MEWQKDNNFSILMCSECSYDRGNHSASLLVRSVIQSWRPTYLFSSNTDMSFRGINAFIQEEGDKDILLFSNYFTIKIIEQTYC